MFPLLDLLQPVVTVCLLSLLFKLNLPLYLILVVAHLLVKVLPLTHQHVNSACETLFEGCVLVFLQEEQLRVLLEDAECVERVLGNTWTEVGGPYVSGLHFGDVWVVESLECICHSRRHR